MAHMRDVAMGAGLLLGMAVTPAALAQQTEQDEIRLLREQLQQMQARLDALEQRAASAEAPPAESSSVASPSPVDVPPLAGTPVSRAPVTAPTTDIVQTTGGLRVESNDGQYSFRLGGRLHWDAYLFHGNDMLRVPPSTTDLRRARLAMQGKVGEWNYRVEHEFAAGSPLDGLRDANISRAFAGGRLTFGQLKPFRSMDELTSSNDMPMMERSFVSANGLFFGRQFQQGVAYQWQDASQDVGIGVSVFNLRSAAGPRNEGYGMAGRVTWTPLREEQRTVHLGGWASREDIGKDGSDITAYSAYGSRRGVSRVVAATNASSGEQVHSVGLEAAGSFGPVFVQSEFSRAWFDRAVGSAQVVTAYYLQGAWLLGDNAHRPYRVGNGVFGAPSISPDGLWELVARFEQVSNPDARDLRTRSGVLGVNWYLNRQTRFMLDYTHGTDSVTGNRLQRLGLRSQLVF